MVDLAGIDKETKGNLMLPPYRQLGLAAFLGLAGLASHVEFSSQASALARGTASGNASGSTTPSMLMNADSNTGMRMTRAPRQGSKVVVLKHQHTVHVSIHDMAFTPAHLVISRGTTVIWTNRDSFQHTSTSDRGLWDSHPLNPNASFTHAFKKTGSFTYHCTIHPFMQGTITVAQ